MIPIETDVLIVGAGPVGLMGARLLGRHQLDTIVAEKRAVRLEAPKAHAVNSRTLEICAAAGLSMEQIYRAATPTGEGAFVRFVENLATPPFGSLPYERQDKAVRKLTPHPLINIAQPAFEEVIERSLATLSSVQVRRGLLWRSCESDGDTIVSDLVDLDSGDHVKIRSRYLIAADGAGSPVREAMQIPMDGPANLTNNMMIHFQADLRALVGEHPGILYFLFGPTDSRVLIAYDISKTWVVMHRCLPEETSKDFGPERCHALVNAAIGQDVPDLQIKTVRRWSMSVQVAKQYRVGNCFLAGDAAHRFPPSGGLGLNTGIGDIDNLCWKIAAVEAGWANPKLLDSYESERREIAQVNATQSHENASSMLILKEALGYGSGLTVSRETLRARLADPQARSAIDAAIALQKDHFDSLRLQLGYIYGENSKVDDHLPINEYSPRAINGAHLPHIVLSDGRSSLDLIAPDRLTLISGPDSQQWSSWVDHSHLPITHRAEGRDFTVSAGNWASQMQLGPAGALLVRPDGHIVEVADHGLASTLTGEANGSWIKRSQSAGCRFY